MARTTSIATFVRRSVRSGATPDRAANAAAEAGYSRSAAFRIAEVETETLAGTLASLRPTPATVARLRDKDRLRWSRIALRTGATVAAVRAAYDARIGEGASAASYTGRGRRPVA